MRAKIVAYKPNGKNTNPLGLGFKAIVVDDNNQLTTESYFIANEHVPLIKGQAIEIDGELSRIKEVFVKTTDNKTVPLSKVTFPSNEENVVRSVNKTVEIFTEKRGEIEVAKIIKRNNAALSTNSDFGAIQV